MSPDGRAPAIPAKISIDEPASPGVLSAAPETVLLARYANSPRPDLEAEIVQRFLPLARSLALRYRGGAEPNEDLIQVANLALVKALRRYDPARGKRFASYAAPTILGELRRHFRDHSWRLHIPRGLQEKTLQVDRMTRELTDELRTSPAVAQIAERTGLTEEDVIDVLQARESQRSVSLDMPVGRDDEGSVSVIETIGKLEAGYDTVEAQIAIEHCAGLTDRERTTIELRFIEGLNQYEIAERIGFSQMQVSRDMRRGLAKLLEAVQGDESPAGKRTFENRPDPRFPNGRSRARPERAAPPV